MIENDPTYALLDKIEHNINSLAGHPYQRIFVQLPLGTSLNLLYWHSPTTYRAGVNNLILLIFY